jgi:hypothetical protein
MFFVCFAGWAQTGAPPDAPSRVEAIPTSPAPSSDDNALALQPFVLAAYSSSATEPSGAHIAGPLLPEPVIATPPAKPRFHWKPALYQSGRYLMVMHAFRFATEPYTRKAIGGPFFADYADSILGSNGWGDGDGMLVNYVGHPLEGSVAGFIYVQNDDKGRNLEFSNTRPYWMSRLRATAWSAAFSIQFEMGPLSEASLGNVGRDPDKYGQTYMGAVDLVITPVMGLGWMVAEDYLDKHAVRGVERRTDSRTLRALARGFMNPSRSFANMMRGKAPWYRDSRPLTGAEVIARQPVAPEAPAPGGTSSSSRSGH